MNALIHSHERQTPPVLLPADITTHKRADSSRIRQRHRRKVQNQGSRLIRTHLGLEAKDIRQY